MSLVNLFHTRLALQGRSQGSDFGIEHITPWSRKAFFSHSGASLQTSRQQVVLVVLICEQVWNKLLNNNMSNILIVLETGSANTYNLLTACKQICSMILKCYSE